MMRSALSAAAALLVSAPAWAQVPVVVTNPNTSPVPASIVNVPSVRVANMPSVNVANIPSVNINNVPSVFVANQPSQGLFYNDVFFVSGVSFVSPPGRVVPAGMRRTITTVSAQWTCPSGHRASLLLHSDGGSIFLPGIFSYTNGGTDQYVVTLNLNAPQRENGAFQALLSTDGAACQGEIDVLGLDLPLQ